MLNPINKDKRIIFLKHLSTSNQIELLTSNQPTIDRAIRQLEYQNEIVGTLIHATCVINGTSSNYQIKDLVTSLNGLWDLEFKLKEEPG
ncbi:MAG: hypothetical protein OEW87_15035, partial [Flavobacteriaceae bacterium]|nr:hypothetical protein [Flavobacteriaceae bacterium]